MAVLQKQFRIGSRWQILRYNLKFMLTLSLPVTRICVNFSTVYNDTLVAKGLIYANFWYVTGEYK